MFIKIDIVQKVEAVTAAVDQSLSWLLERAVSRSLKQPTLRYRHAQGFTPAFLDQSDQTLALEPGLSVLRHFRSDLRT